MFRNPVSSLFTVLRVKPYLVCNRRFNKTRIASTMKTLDESDVVIFCFISYLPGFRGILKQRYSDFMVNEVDTDGNVVHLTCLDAPPEEIVDHKETKMSDQMNKSYDSEIELFRSLAGDCDAQCLEDLINQVTSGTNEDNISPIVPSAIQINPIGRFHLYKENKDTQEALGLMGKILGIQPRSFGFPGTKDKSSVSTQRVTVFKQHAIKLAALNKRLFGIQLGDFCYIKEGLLLRQLHGNRFIITLWGVVADSEDVIKASANSLGRNGFINCFGLQCFGSGSVPTHLIGATLLCGEWKTAVNMILDPREGESNEISKTWEYYKETNDIDGTLRKLARHLVAERSMLQCLKKCPGNCLQALKAIPRTLQMMYVHSYQSYLWNHAASMRVEKYGTEQPVVGDLVYCKGGDTVKEMGCFSSEDENSNGTDDCSHLDEASATDLRQGKHNLVKTVTAEDIQTGKYTINDVVLPMPGSRVIYPMNDVAEVYHHLAKKDEINLTESVHNVKEFSITSMTGSYRQVFQKPMDFEWELLTYTDVNKPLAETDLDKIAQAKPVNIVKEEEPVNRNEKKDPFDGMKQSESLGKDLKISKENNKADSGKEGKQLHVESFCGSNSQEAQMAIKLGFTLPASCYVTMAIRELLKTSTSVAFHKTLN